MYISELYIKNFRGFNNEVSISFHEGINVLIGHNNAGKTTIIKALELLFDNNATKRLKIDDFNKNLNIQELKGTPPSITISAKVTESEKEDEFSDDLVTIATWLTKLERPYEAQITFEYFLPEKELEDYCNVLNQITSNEGDDYWNEIETRFLKKYTYKIYVGKPEYRVSIDSESLKKFDFQFLNAIRDVERDLYSGRNTLLRDVIDYFIDYDIKDNKKLPEEEKRKRIDERKKVFNQSTSKLIETLHSRLLAGKDQMLQYADKTGATFDKSKPGFSGRVLDTDLISALRLIVENETGIKIQAAQNGLGYNNLIYISLLLARMQKDASGQYLGSNAKIYPILAIEEPEAHLHPSMQYKFLKFLKENHQSNVRQIFITTHSPNITAAVDLDDIIVLHKAKDTIEIAYPGRVFSDSDNDKHSKAYVERFLDVTKSDMLFAKKIIFVEGIAEQMLIPAFAKYMDEDLSDYHTAVINIGGRCFDHFLKLFDTQKNSCAICKEIICITDLDPNRKNKNDAHASWEKCFPFELMKDNENYEYQACSNPIVNGCNNGANNIAVFSQELNKGCTLEYEIIRENAGIELLITENVQNTQEIKNLMVAYKKDAKLGDLIKILRKSESNKRIAEINTDWDEKQTKEHVIAARYLSSIRKGEAAQELAQVIENNKTALEGCGFKVPSYLKKAIESVCHQ
jgi:Predicted ATP-dependent endonuclease of the OLD family